MRISLLVLLVASFVLLPACGGGGGTGAVSAVPPASQNGTAPSITFPAHFAITDLGANAFPVAVNASGAVAGTVNNRAFLMSGGATIIFGTLNGAPSSEASDLNDAGIAVGDSGGDGVAFEPDGSIVDLGTASSNLIAFDLSITNSNQIVGLSREFNATNCGGSITSFSFGGAPAIIGPKSLSVKINDSATFVAAVYNETGPQCTGTITPTLFPSGTPLTVPPVFTLQTHPGAIVNDINDAGMVLGVSPTTSNVFGTFVLQPGTPGTAIVLPGESIVGVAINTQGWIVGGFHAPSHAFVDVSGNIIDLNSLLPAGCAAWTLVEATDINDSGDIVGDGMINGVPHGFLLTPQP